MNKDIIVGIPRSLLFYMYGDIWIYFFKYLNIKYILSPKTNKRIINNGVKLSNSEACLSLKLFLGHVHFLKNKCDYIFIPRVDKLANDEIVCTNFNAIFDLSKNIFKDNKILYYNINYKKNEQKEFIKIGKILGKNKKDSILAYKYAKKKYNEKISLLQKENELKLNSKNKKILVLGQNYNLFDEFVGNEVMKLIKNNNIDICYPISNNNNLYKKIMPTMYFSYSKNMINSILKYKRKINGIIIVTAFPCGSDSLVIEMIKRKIKNIPIIIIVFDELMSNSGLITRIESFIDIVKESSNEN